MEPPPLHLVPPIFPPPRSCRQLTFLGHREKVANRIRNIVDQRGGYEGRVKQSVASVGRNNAKREEHGRPRKIFRAQRPEVFFAFHPRIDHVQRLDKRHKTKEPAAPRPKVVFVPGVSLQITWEQKNSQEEIRGSIKTDEEVKGEGPLRDVA